MRESKTSLPQRPGRGRAEIDRRTAPQTEDPMTETSNDDALRAPFGDWLAARWPDVEALEVGAFELPKSGFSAKTVFVPLRPTCVTARTGRRQGRASDSRTRSPRSIPQQAPGLDVEIEIQYRSMELLEKTRSRPAGTKPIGYEPDRERARPTLLRDGLLSEGEVMTENPPYVERGLLRRRLARRRERTIYRARAPAR